MFWSLLLPLTKMPTISLKKVLERKCCFCGGPHLIFIGSSGESDDGDDEDGNTQDDETATVKVDDGNGVDNIGDKIDTSDNVDHPIEE